MSRPVSPTQNFLHELPCFDALDSPATDIAAEQTPVSAQYKAFEAWRAQGQAQRKGKARQVYPSPDDKIVNALTGGRYSAGVSADAKTKAIIRPKLGGALSESQTECLNKLIRSKIDAPTQEMGDSLQHALVNFCRKFPWVLTQEDDDVFALDAGRDVNFTLMNTVSVLRDEFAQISLGKPQLNESLRSYVDALGLAEFVAIKNYAALAAYEYQSLMPGALDGPAGKKQQNPVDVLRDEEGFLRIRKMLNLRKKAIEDDLAQCSVVGNRVPQSLDDLKGAAMKFAFREMDRFADIAEKIEDGKDFSPYWEMHVLGYCQFCFDYEKSVRLAYFSGEGDLPHSRELAEYSNIPTRFKTSVELAARDLVESRRFEGRIAKMVGNKLTGFNRILYDATGGTIGEIDLETEKALIEVTLNNDGKKDQILRYVQSEDFNPFGKDVILLAPNYTNKDDLKLFRDLNVRFVRDENEFRGIIKKIHRKAA